MKKVTINCEIKKNIIKLYLIDSLSLKSISNKLNISISLITRFLKENHIYFYKNCKKGKLELYNSIKNTDICQSYNKNFGQDKIAICKKTQKIFHDYENKSGSLTLHLKKIYPDLIIPSKYIRKQYFIQNNKYWHEKFFIITTQKINKSFKQCKFCEWVTKDTANKSGSYTKHLLKKHNISIEKYLKQYPSEKYLFQTFKKQKEREKFINSKEDNRIKCEICGQNMKKITNTHLKKHNITLKEYKRKYNTTLSNSSKEKFINIAINLNNKKRKFGEITTIENILLKKLTSFNIQFEYEKRVNKYFFDFYLPELDLYIEVDGKYWHGHDRISNWDIIPFNNIINDYHKSKTVKNLIRLLEDDITSEVFQLINNKEKLIDFLHKKNFNIKNHTLFNLEETQIIFSKQYCQKHIDNIHLVINNLLFLLKNFYSPPNYKQIIDINNRHTTTSKLKVILFESFYNSHKIKHKNLYETFQNDKKLLKAIKYRLGLNNSKEFFNITLKELYRGIEVSSLFHVSIFPVSLAEKIYCNNTEQNYKIYDPFAGWGSRLLGAKKVIMEKNCSYIGNDINNSLKEGYQTIINYFFKEKYKKNISLYIDSSKNLNNKLKNQIDFIFSSPPFYNDEIYTEEQMKYNSIQEWEQDLLLPIFKNCFQYLKHNKKIIIDMKNQYLESVKHTLVQSGFKILEINEYSLTRSHYSKIKNKKTQSLIVGLKP